MRTNKTKTAAVLAATQLFSEDDDNKPAKTPKAKFASAGATSLAMEEARRAAIIKQMQVQRAARIAREQQQKSEEAKEE